MHVKGNLGKAESHSQLCDEKSSNSSTCFGRTASHLHQENSTPTIKDPVKKEIHIGAFVPFMKDDRYGYYTAMKMAINLINNRTDILDNFTLVLDSVETHSVSAEIRLSPLFVRISLFLSSYFSQLLTAFCFTHIFLSKSRQNETNFYQINKSNIVMINRHPSARVQGL